MTAKRGFAHFSHGADIGIRAWGPTLAAAYEEAARGMISAVASLGKIDAKQKVSIACEAPDPELLLADWLNAVIYEIDTRDMLFSRFEVVLDGTRLKAALWGEPIEQTRHEAAVDLKGATYTALSVRQEENGCWVAECVVDV